jgi:hypothetical protein
MSQNLPLRVRYKKTLKKKVLQDVENLSRFLKIFYIALQVPSFANYQLESQRQREAVFKLQFESSFLARQDGTFLFLMVQFLLKNPDLEPDGKGFGEPKPSLPSRFSKKVKEIFKNITNLYHSHPYKHRLLILICMLTVSTIYYYSAIFRYTSALNLGYLSNYLIELNSRLRLIELLEKYKKAKFLKPRSFENLPFHNVPVENSLNSLTNLEIEDYKKLQTDLLENKLKSRLLVYQIFALAQELNLSPKSTWTLISIALLVLRFRKDSSDTASFILLVKFLLKIFGSTDSSSWTDPNE